MPSEAVAVPDLIECMEAVHFGREGGLVFFLSSFCSSNALPVCSREGGSGGYGTGGVGRDCGRVLNGAVTGGVIELGEELTEFEFSEFVSGWGGFRLLRGSGLYGRCRFIGWWGGGAAPRPEGHCKWVLWGNLIGGGESIGCSSGNFFCAQQPKTTPIF